MRETDHCNALPAPIDAAEVAPWLARIQAGAAAAGLSQRELVELLICGAEAKLELAGGEADPRRRSLYERIAADAAAVVRSL